MTLLRPTLQGRRGFDPGGHGPGVNAPYGYSPVYFNGTRMHNGQDYFWLGAESAARLNISTEASKGVYAVVDGPVYRVDDSALGLGLYQQIDTAHRAYYWHLSERVSNGTYKTTDRIGRMGLTGTAAGTGEHVHFEVREAPYGSANRKDPEPFFQALAALEPHQRRVLASAPVMRRSEPSSKSAVAGDPLEAGVVGNFNGWIRGEVVNNNSVWFRGISGDWFWSGGFTDTSTRGLADLNPKPVTKPTRLVLSVPANVRDKPSTTGAVVGVLAGDSRPEVHGYTLGQSVSQNGITTDVWFKVAAGWSWSGGFAQRETSGLALILETEPAPAPAPVNVLDPRAPWKAQTPDVAIAKWVGSPNYNYREPSATKRHFTEHWMAGTLAGTDRTFQNPGTITPEGRGTGVASNFGVGQTEVHQYVLLKDYQQADGDRVSNTYGVSVEHEGGPDAPITDAVYALSARLHAQVMLTPGWEGGDRLVVGQNVFPHSKWVATQCPGTLDLERIARETNAILDAMEPVAEPDPVTDPVTAPGEAPGWFVRFLDAIMAAIKGFLGK